MSSFPLNAVFSNPGASLCAPASCSCQGACSCSSSCPTTPCGVPGNGLGSFVPGANPFPVLATAALQDYRAVAITVGGIQYADNANPAHQVATIGIIGVGANSGAQASVYWGGPITNPINGSGGWNWTLGTPIFLGTNGQLTQVAPSPSAGFTRAVGIPLSANTIMLLSQIPNVAPFTPRSSSPAFSASITIDGTATDVANVTLTGNTTLTLVGGFDGHELQIRLTQDAVGGRLVAYNGVDFGTGAAPTLSVDPLLVDLLIFTYVSAIGEYVFTRVIQGLTV